MSKSRIILIILMVVMLIGIGIAVCLNNSPPAPIRFWVVKPPLLAEDGTCQWTIGMTNTSRSKNWIIVYDFFAEEEPGSSYPLPWAPKHAGEMLEPGEYREAIWSVKLIPGRQHCLATSQVRLHGKWYRKVDDWIFHHPSLRIFWPRDKTYSAYGEWSTNIASLIPSATYSRRNTTASKSAQTLP